MGWVVNTTPRPLYAQERGPVPIVWEVGWVLGPVWTGAENLAPTGIRSPDRPARSESLYRLSYPCPLFKPVGNVNVILVLKPVYRQCYAIAIRRYYIIG
jgi:hypothetical protein